MKPDRRSASTLIDVPPGPHDGVLMAAVPAFVVGSISVLVLLTAWLGTASAFEPATWAMILAAVTATLADGWLLLRLRDQSTRVWRRVDAIEASMVGHGRATSLTAAPQPESPWVGLPEGSIAPAFRLGGVHGEVLTLDALRAAEKPVLLVFLDLERGRSRALRSMVGNWQHENIDRLTVVLVGRRTTDLDRSGITEAQPAHVLLQEDLEVAREYRVERLPSAVLVRADGTIGSQVAFGEDAIRDVIRRATIGTKAPGPIPARALVATETTHTLVSSQAFAIGALPAAADVTIGCDACVQDCQERGGGASCRLVCELGGPCATA